MIGLVYFITSDRYGRAPGSLDGTYMIEVEMGHETQVYHLIHRPVAVLLLQLREIRKLLLVVEPHVQTAVQQDPLVRDLHQNTTPAHVLPSAQAIYKYFRRHFVIM